MLTTDTPTSATTMLEIACFTSSSAITAALAGAARIELCASYTLGGITPSLSTLLHIRDEIQFTSMEESLTGETKTRHGRIPVNVMIRPRGGDFNYSAAEFAQMKRSIEVFKESEGVDGFVFGLLTVDKRLAEERNRELVELAKPLPCTFHRAIDEVQDLDDAVETIIRCGFRSILTSGGAKNASEGADEVARLQRKFGERISFILGGGVRNTNVVELKSRTCVEWVHSAAITEADEEVDDDEVRRMVTLLQNA